MFVPLFRRFQLGAILGYLFAGILIGPDVTKLIKDPKVILHFSELGVVFLLFIIGLELAPARLWKLRKLIFGFGLLQMLITGSFFTGIAYLLGLSGATAFATGFGLALSSTAFSVQILDEHHQLNTMHGQGSFSVLMFQDLAVVPILAALAFFSNDPSSTLSLRRVVEIIFILIALILIGRYVISHMFRLIADSHTQEVFTAMSLLIVVGTATLMESLGLSMGMGAFFAGVLLANSEYRHELETNLMPFKGLLLGLFFIAVGMSLDLNVLLNQPHWVVLITLVFMITKGIIIYTLGRLFGFPHEPSRNMAFTLPQGGEFAFVIFSTALAQSLIDGDQSSVLSAAVTLSMALTPIIFSFNQKYFRSFSEVSEAPTDKFKSDNAEVIIAGYGRFGQIVSRFLSAEQVKHTILEHSAAQLEVARSYGMKIYYGDASRADILRAAGANDAKIFVLAIDDTEGSIDAAKTVRKEFPHLEIIARARNRQHAIDLMELGITNIHRETYLTSLEVAKEVMLFKGDPRETINKRLAKFRKHDEEILRNQFNVRHDVEKFISYTNKANKELEEILIADKKEDD